jgi:hypothetical protein
MNICSGGYNNIIIDGRRRGIVKQTKDLFWQCSERPLLQKALREQWTTCFVETASLILQQRGTITQHNQQHMTLRSQSAYSVLADDQVEAAVRICLATESYTERMPRQRLDLSFMVSYIPIQPSGLSPQAGVGCRVMVGCGRDVERVGTGGTVTLRVVVVTRRVDVTRRVVVMMVGGTPTPPHLPARQLRSPSQSVSSSHGSPEEEVSQHLDPSSPGVQMAGARRTSTVTSPLARRIGGLRGPSGHPDSRSPDDRGRGWPSTRLTDSWVGTSASAAGEVAVAVNLGLAGVT